jgi:hypothetical protein
MTLDASGNLGVGTTSPSSLVSAGHASSAQKGFTVDFTGGGGPYAVASLTADMNTGEVRIGGVRTNFFPTFYSNNSERARIDSSGNLLVGTASNGGAKFKSFGNGGTIGASIDPNSTTATSLEIIVGANDTTQSAMYVYSSANSAFNFKVQSNGNAENRNNSYGAISDVKLKENIVDASPKLADLMQVKVRNYNLIGSEAKQIGVVAQELETVFPSMVDETLDRDIVGNDLGTTTKSVKYSVFVPMLIKAMQEQQAIIESLKARLDAANI